MWDKGKVKQEDQQDMERYANAIPELKGTEKQIAWAKKIITQALKTHQQQISRYEAMAERSPKFAKGITDRKTELERFYVALEKNDYSAAWVIDTLYNRSIRYIADEKYI